MIFVHREWIEHPTRGSSVPCSTIWATSAFEGFAEFLQPYWRHHFSQHHVYDYDFNRTGCLPNFTWRDFGLRGRGGIRTHCVSHVSDLQSDAHPPSEQPSQICLTTLNFRLDSNQRAPLDVIYLGCVSIAFRVINTQSNHLLRSTLQVWPLLNQSVWLLFFKERFNFVTILSLLILATW